MTIRRLVTGLAIAAALLVLAPPTRAAKQLVTFLTSGARNDGASATSITTVESPTVTAGNAILVAVRSNTTTETVSSVTDTAGNTYAAVTSAVTSSVTTLEFWYAYNIAGHAANFVTANFTGSVGSRTILAVEVTGLLASGDPLDVSATGTAGTSFDVTSGTFTTTEAETLLVAMSNQEAGSGNWYAYAPSLFGVVLVGSDAVPTLACAMRVVTSIQTNQTVKFASSNNVPRQVIVAAFKIADATGGGGGEVSHTFSH